MIELKNVHKSYLMGSVVVNALQGVSLKITPGEFIAIIGPSGSGKSTLMHILGLLDRPDSGDYILGEEKVDALSDERLSLVRNRLIGFVFQQFHLLPRMSALNNVGLPLIYSGNHESGIRSQQLLGEVGLSDRINHRPNELSGGQQQRVAIARALVNDPLILMADEPTGNLDTKSKDEIMAILEGLNKKGKTVILVTHESEIASRARRIITMRDGRMVSDVQTAKGINISAVQDAKQRVSAVLSATASSVRETKFLDYLKQAADSMLSHKLRSFLSILGILIGVAAVIAMLALGQGAKESIEQQLSSLGSNLLLVRPGSPKMMGIALEAGAVTRFTFRDVEDIAGLHELIKRVSPSVTGRAQVVYANKNWNTQVEGTGVEIAQIRSIQPVVGRFFNEAEVKVRDKVAVLGPTVVTALFGENNPVGETIKINLINFKVIGVLPSKGGSSFRDPDDTILIPVTTAMQRLLGKEYIDTIYAEAVSAQRIPEAQEEISRVIIKQHHLSKNEEDSFSIHDLSDIKTALTTTTRTMSLLLGAIAAISLLVGGIGIMNIMLVSVTERTREIGLRKAIGANNLDILVQFLIESVLMSFIGGISGVLLGSGIAVLITLFTGWSVKVSLFSVLLSTIFSLVVGLLFGIWPARQASKLNPIEALRYE